MTERRHIELSGIKKRKRNTPGQRPFILTVRFNEQEKAALAEKASHAGITRSDFIRLATLNTPPPRGRRVPSVNEKMLAQVLAQLGKIGSNVNQLAHYAHLDKFQPHSIELAMRDLHEMRHVLMQALGLERPLPHEDEGDQAA